MHCNDEKKIVQNSFVYYNLNLSELVRTGFEITP